MVGVETSILNRRKWQKLEVAEVKRRLFQMGEFTVCLYIDKMN